MCEHQVSLFVAIWPLVVSGDAPPIHPSYRQQLAASLMDLIIQFPLHTPDHTVSVFTVPVLG
jgi:hypothetical protein